MFSEQQQRSVVARKPSFSESRRDIIKEEISTVLGQSNSNGYAYILLGLDIFAHLRMLFWVGRASSSEARRSRFEPHLISLQILLLYLDAMKLRCDA